MEPGRIELPSKVSYCLSHSAASPSFRLSRDGLAFASLSSTNGLSLSSVVYPTVFSSFRVSLTLVRLGSKREGVNVLRGNDMIVCI